MTEEESILATIPPLCCSLCGDAIEDQDEAVPEVAMQENQAWQYIYFHPDCHKEVRPPSNEW